MSAERIESLTSRVFALPSAVADALIVQIHGEAVTHAENMRRLSQAQTSCRKAGHDWTDPNNVYIRSNGSRCCAECSRIDLRGRYAARKAAS